MSNKIVNCAYTLTDDNIDNIYDTSIVCIDIKVIRSKIQAQACSPKFSNA